MPSITITRPHSLDHAQAKDAADRLAQDLHKRFNVAYHWAGDQVVFQRSGVSGTLDVRPAEITLELKLGLLLGALKPTIEREVHAQLDRLGGPPDIG